MYEPDYNFLPKSFWEDLRKKVDEEIKMEPVNFNRPENIRQEFWDAVDEMVRAVGRQGDISLMVSITPDGFLNATVNPWPEDDEDDPEAFVDDYLAGNYDKT